MREKIQFKLKHLLVLLLVVPAAMFVFWFGGYATFVGGVNPASFTERLALAASTSSSLCAQTRNAPVSVSERETPVRRDYGPVLRNASMPIVNNRAILGISLRTCPESNAVYRNRREGPVSYTHLTLPTN